MERVEFLTDYFSKNWRKDIYDVSSSNLVADHIPLIEPIADMELKVEPLDAEVVVNGWKYVGPGNIVLDVYLDLDYILNYPIDHYMVAREFLIPWLDRTILKFFGFNIYTDFADVVINFYDHEGYSDTYDIDVTETNTDNFYFNKPKYWEKID